MTKEVTYEVAKEAAKEVDFIKSRGNLNKYYSYTNYYVLVDLEYVLQEYRQLCYSDNTTYEFEDEYNWIRNIVGIYYHQEEAYADLI